MGVTFLVSFFQLVFPWTLKIIIDDVIPNADFHLLYVVTAVVVSSLIFRFFLEWYKEYKVRVVVEKVVSDIRNKLFSHIQNLPLNFFASHTVGDLMSRLISDVQSVRFFLSLAVAEFFAAVVSFFTILAVLLYMNIKLTAVAFVFFPFFCVFYYKAIVNLEKSASEELKSTSLISSIVGEVLQGIKVVKAYNMFDFEKKRFETSQSRLINAAVKTQSIQCFIWLFSDFVSFLGTSVLLLIGTLDIINGKSTTGDLVAFYSYVGMLFSPLIRIVSINNYWHEACSSFCRMDEILGEEDDNNKACGCAKPKRDCLIKGAIDFDNVSFWYDNKREVIRDASFHVEPGETVAIVGPSGAGKSTIVNLLLRFYVPQKGNILVDGNDIRSLDVEKYRDNVAIVMQDDFLVSGTVKDNILFGAKDKTHEDVVRAAMQASAHSFITALAYGYETYIGERGVLLSGGQRQRISIARAFLRNSQILIFDEATSALDVETEVVVQKALGELIKQRKMTTFIIAHRLSTVRSADKIVVVVDGNIESVGKHANLMRCSELYKRLYTNDKNRLRISWL